VEWDKVRRSVLREALQAHLLPAMEREARARLAGEARGVVLEGAADRLWGYASQAALQVCAGRAAGRPACLLSLPASAHRPGHLPTRTHLLPLTSTMQHAPRCAWWRTTSWRRSGA
jgi:hypothetical protein